MTRWKYTTSTVSKSTKTAGQVERSTQQSVWSPPPASLCMRSSRHFGSPCRGATYIALSDRTWGSAGRLYRVRALLLFRIDRKPDINFFFCCTIESRCVSVLVGHKVSLVEYHTNKIHHYCSTRRCVLLTAAAAALAEGCSTTWLRHTGETQGSLVLLLAW